MTINLKFCFAGWLLSGLFLTQTLSSATRVLYWNDRDEVADLVTSEDSMAAALDGLALSEDFEVTVATGDNHFATEIASGNYDLGILFIQLGNLEDDFASRSALADFASTGGWAMYSDFTASNAWGAEFGFQYTDNENLNALSIAHPAMTQPNDIESPVQLAPYEWESYSHGLSDRCNICRIQGPGASGDSTIRQPA